MKYLYSLTFKQHNYPKYTEDQLLQNDPKVGSLIFNNFLLTLTSKGTSYTHFIFFQFLIFSYDLESKRKRKSGKCLKLVILTTHFFSIKTKFKVGVWVINIYSTYYRQFSTMWGSLWNCISFYMVWNEEQCSSGILQQNRNKFCWGRIYESGLLVETAQKHYLLLVFCVYSHTHTHIRHGRPTYTHSTNLFVSIWLNIIFTGLYSPYILT